MNERISKALGYILKKYSDGQYAFHTIKVRDEVFKDSSVRDIEELMKELMLLDNRITKLYDFSDEKGSLWHFNKYK